MKIIYNVKNRCCSRTRGQYSLTKVKKFKLIEKKVTILYYFSGMPDPPSCVSLTVASSSSLLVRFDEPLNHNGAVVTKYRGK
jgi:hypothetical protein